MKKYENKKGKIPNLKNIIMIKPFIKWAGGKTQIIKEVVSKFPIKINNYYEPFLGGGSVLIELIKMLEEGKVIIEGNINTSDINRILILTYKNIKSNSKKLISRLNKLSKNYNNAEMKKIYQGKRPKNIVAKNLKTAKEQGKEELYYFYRNKFNKLKVKEELEEKDELKLASLFIFLNKTGFRGLYRETKNKFNVPFGNYKNPQILDKHNLKKLSKLFNRYNINFTCEDFNNISEKIEKNDFVYLDSPYYPENEKSFVKYVGDGFNLEQHNKLKKLCDLIEDKEGNFLESNSCTPYINKLYQEYNISNIECKRSINSKKPDARTFEVLINNKNSNNLIEMMSNIKILTNYLSDQNVINWVKCSDEWINKHNLSNKKNGEIYNQLEKEWGKNLTKKYNNQWTTTLGESLLEEVLIKLGKKVWRPNKINNYKPDWETKDAIWEVKTRTWTTSGTAGEKILGTPFKYCEIPSLYKKKLNIVTVAYQEYEAIKFGCFGGVCKEKDNMIKYWKNRNINYLKFTDLLKQAKIIS